MTYSFLSNLFVKRSMFPELATQTQEMSTTCHQMSQDVNCNIAILGGAQLHPISPLISILFHLESPKFLLYWYLLPLCTGCGIIDPNFAGY